MKKKNEKLGKLLGDLNSILGDTNKSTEIFYLLKKHGVASEGQRKEIIELAKQIVKNQQFTKTYADKYLELLSYLKQQGELSQLQKSDLVDLEKDLLGRQNDVEKNLLKLTEIAKSLKIQLPKTFDVSIKNTRDFPTEFRISNLDEIPKSPDEINIRQPAWLPNFLEAAFKFITQPLITVIKKQLQNVNITGPTDPKKAIAVRLSDGNRFYTAILQAISAAGSNSQKVEDLLQEIANNTDTLELKADQVNLNTDTLETLLEQFQFVSGRLKVDTDISIPSDPNSDIARSTRASEATLVQVRDYLDTVEAKLQILIDGNVWQRAVVAGTGFVATTNNITVANANETVFMLIKNPSNSGKTARLHRLTIGSDQNQANKMAFYRIYRDPTITNNGTALVISNLKKGAGVSALTAFRIPSVSDNGILLAVGNAGAVIQGTEQMDLGNLILAGENILITVDATAGGFDFFVTAYWEEV